MDLQALLRIRVQIIDREALKQITPTMLERYLRRQSFAVYEYASVQSFSVYEYGSFPPREALWTLADEQGISCPVWVPLTAEIGDYVRRVSEVLSELSGFEQRSQLAIYVDMLEGT